MMIQMSQRGELIGTKGMGNTTALVKHGLKILAFIYPGKLIGRQAGIDTRECMKLFAPFRQNIPGNTGHGRGIKPAAEHAADRVAAPQATADRFGKNLPELQGVFFIGGRR